MALGRIIVDIDYVSPLLKHIDHLVSFLFWNPRIVLSLQYE